MKGIYEEKYSPKVYKDILQFYKEYEEKKHQDSNGQEMMKFHQKRQGKHTNTCLQKRGMQLFKKCLKYIEAQHPNILKEELCNVVKSIYEKMYSGSNQIVLYY